MTALILNLFAILYSLVIKILCVTHLHFIKDQYMTFVFFIVLAR